MYPALIQFAFLKTDSTISCYGSFFKRYLFGPKTGMEYLKAFRPDDVIADEVPVEDGVFVADSHAYSLV